MVAMQAETEDLTYRLALAHVPGFKAKHANVLLPLVGNSCKTLWHKPIRFLEAHLKPTLLTRFLALRDTLDLSGLRAKYQDITLLTDLPPLLQNSHDPPFLLFVKGNASILTGRTLGWVGSRKASPYGLRVCQQLLSGLTPYQPIIVSGLAQGIDAACHQAALDNGLPTVAVFGCGVDVIYPSTHRTLAANILAAGGALVSEYPLGTPPEAQRFPERNRIVAGLCEGVVVVEGTERSGSLITARLALEENRTLFAVPGNITSPQAEGPNRLIRQGAVPVTCAEDIAQELRWQPEERSSQLTLPSALSPMAAHLCAMLSDEPQTVESLSVKSNLSVADTSATLTLLELSQKALALPGGRYTRLD
jgi:DNA processing protein